VNIGPNRAGWILAEAKPQAQNSIVGNNGALSLIASMAAALILRDRKATFETAAIRVRF